jgi:hypothetical protein
MNSFLNEINNVGKDSCQLFLNITAEKISGYPSDNDLMENDNKTTPATHRHRPEMGKSFPLAR